jgi:hypothetical protein
MRCERRFIRNPPVDLLAENAHIAWSVETQFHRVAANLQNGDHHVGTDHHALSIFSAEYEHDRTFLFENTGSWKKLPRPTWHRVGPLWHGFAPRHWFDDLDLVDEFFDSREIAKHNPGHLAFLLRNVNEIDTE